MAKVALLIGVSEYETGLNPLPVAVKDVEAMQRVLVHSEMGGSAKNITVLIGGKGRAILTSSTSTQYSFEQEGSELSVYTKYLVEGIEKGEADLEDDGWIAVDARLLAKAARLLFKRLVDVLVD